MSQTLSPKILTITGNGLITGLPVTVQIEQAPFGHGIVFYLEDGSRIPALLSSVVHTDRGVTLGHPSGKTLSIVEHFLSACAMANLMNLKVQVSGAPELPLLDGSAQPWLDPLQQVFGCETPPSDILLRQSITYRHSEEIRLYALPASHLKVSYAVNFPHKGLQQQFVYWDSKQDGLNKVSPARTFGFVKELPILQAQGLARGVSLENTLGLTEEGGYTTSLRLEDEPVRHKLLDFLGDLTLMGFNPLRLQAHLYVLYGGHSSHTAFAKQLQRLASRGSFPAEV